MPIPKFEFEDADAGLPRQPVPVRFACMAANWHPSAFARFVGGLTDEIGPIVTVYAFEPQSKIIGEVVPTDYSGYLALQKVPLADAIAKLPSNHFVWSDELITSFSDYVDLCLDRATARLDGLYIRWTPDLKNCGDAVLDCVDLSSLSELKSSENRMYLEDDTWTITFGGVTKHIRDQTGFRYIRHLLSKPDTWISVRDLRRVVEPDLPATERMPIGAVSSEEGYAAEFDKGDEESSPSRQAGEEEISDNEGEIEEVDLEEGAVEFDPAEDDVDDAALEKAKLRRQNMEGRQIVGDPDGDLEATDEESIRDYRAQIANNEKLIKIATEGGDFKGQVRLEKETAFLKKHLSSVVKKTGKARLTGPHERRRKVISNAVTRAIKKLDKLHPAFAQHLNIHLRMGGDFSYTAGGATAWTLRADTSPKN